MACGDFFLVSECNISFNELDGQKIHLFLVFLLQYPVNLIWRCSKGYFQKRTTGKSLSSGQTSTVNTNWWKLHQFVFTFKIKLPKLLVRKLGFLKFASGPKVSPNNSKTQTVLKIEFKVKTNLNRFSWSSWMKCSGWKKN